MKRKLLAVSLLIICAALMAAGSVAFFNAEGKAHNVITTGGVDIELNEWADVEKETPWENGTHGTGVMPGETVVKIAEVKNTGSSDAWIRVKVEKELNLDREYGALLGDKEPDMSKIEIVIGEDWEDGEDGFYYYNKPVKPGETTSPIFEEVAFDAAMGNEFQKATADVNVTAYAVQVANNGKSAMDAAGWPTEQEETTPAAIQ